MIKIASCVLAFILISEVLSSSVIDRLLPIFMTLFCRKSFKAMLTCHVIDIGYQLVDDGSACDLQPSTKILDIFSRTTGLFGSSNKRKIALYLSNLYPYNIQFLICITKS